MELTQLSDELFISPQIEISDLKELKSLGFHLIIVNRPDGEGKKQPSHVALRSSAQPLGIDVKYIPVVPGRVSQQSVDRFARALSGASGKTLAFCESGMRAKRLWEKAFPDQVQTWRKWLFAWL